MTTADVAELRITVSERSPTDREVLERILVLVAKVAERQEDLGKTTAQLCASVAALKGQLGEYIEAARTAVNVALQVKRSLDDLREELGHARSSAEFARADAELSRRVATSAVEILDEQERERRRARDTDPDLSRYESSAPPAP
jgi:ABC-type transporter Mla subunit MlaD